MSSSEIHLSLLLLSKFVSPAGSVIILTREHSLATHKNVTLDSITPPHVGRKDHKNFHSSKTSSDFKIKAEFCLDSRPFSRNPVQTLCSGVIQCKAEQKGKFPGSVTVNNLVSPHWEPTVEHVQLE